LAGGGRLLCYLTMLFEPLKLYIKYEDDHEWSVGTDLEGGGRLCYLTVVFELLKLYIK
jgi:hypothetical protein